MLILLALALFQTPPTEAELDRMVEEHAGLVREIADSPVTAARRAKDKARAEALEFAHGPCLCGAARHADCKDRAACDPVEDPIKQRLADAYKRATDRLKELEAGDLMKTLDRRIARRNEIASFLGVDARLYELRKRDIDDALTRQRRARDLWKSSNDRIADIRSDLNADVKDALREAEHARLKAWADVAVDALSCVLMSERLKALLPVEKHQVMANALGTLAGAVRDLWDQVAREKSVNSTEILKNVTDSMSTLRGLLAAVSDDAGVKTLAAANTIYTLLATAVAGAGKTADAPDWKLKGVEVVETLIQLAATVNPVAAVGQAGGRTAQALYLSVRLDGSIGDMKAALETTGEHATIAERRLRAVQRRLAACEQLRPHASD